MRAFAVVLVLTILAGAHIVSLRKLTDAARLMPKNEETASVVPPAILRITSLEFRSLVSDYLFLKSLVFIGSTFERTEKPRVKNGEWKWVYNTLDASTTLDPYFLDPYYLANAFLTWDAFMIQEDNLLLIRGSKHRDWDSILPFFVGFNYFYFLQDNVNARKWLLEASEKPDAPHIFYTELASKLSNEKNRTNNAIAFLEEMTKKTNDESLKDKYASRISYLRSVLQVERAVELYKKKFGKQPSDLKTLVQTGLVREIPADPYGEQLYLDSDGHVKSSSNAQFDVIH